MIRPVSITIAISGAGHWGKARVFGFSQSTRAGVVWSLFFAN